MIWETVQNFPAAAFAGRNLQWLSSKQAKAPTAADRSFTTKVFHSMSHHGFTERYLNSEYCSQVLETLKSAQISKVEDYMLPRSDVKHPYAIRGNLFSVYSEDCKDRILQLSEEDPRASRLLCESTHTVLDLIRFDEREFLAADCQKRLLLISQPPPETIGEKVSVNVLGVSILSRTLGSQLSLYGAVFHETPASIFAIGLDKEVDPPCQRLVRLSKKDRGQWEFLHFRDVSSFCTQKDTIYLITQTTSNNTGFIFKLREAGEGVIRVQAKERLAADIDLPVQKLVVGEVFVFSAGFFLHQDHKKKYTVLYTHFKNLRFADSYKIEKCSFFITSMIATRHAGLDFLFVLDQIGFFYIFCMKGEKLCLLQAPTKDHIGAMFGLHLLDPQKDRQLQTADRSADPLFFLHLGDYRMMRVVKVEFRADA